MYEFAFFAVLFCFALFPLSFFFILYKLSKRFGRLWEFTKVAMTIYFAAVVFVAILLSSHFYFESLPSNKFAKATGRYPPSGVSDLRIVSIRRENRTGTDFIFKANQETIDLIAGKCFSNVPAAEAVKKIRFDDNADLKRLIENQSTKYFKRLEIDDLEIEKYGCSGDISRSYLAYDELSKEAYFQWNEFHF